MLVLFVTVRIIYQKVKARNQIEHRHCNPVASIEPAYITKFIIYFTVHERKKNINKFSRSKTPKQQQVEGFTHLRQTSCILVSTQNFAYLSCLKKFSFL